MFIISFCFAYFVSRDFHIALFVGIFTVYARIIYRYNTEASIVNFSVHPKNNALFASGLVGIVIISFLLSKLRSIKWIKWILHIAIIYIIASFGEWIIHKYIMHCYIYSPWLLELTSKMSFISYIKNSCVLHKNHHTSVKKDMTLSNINDESELIFTYYTIFFITISIGLISYPIIHILHLDISIIHHIIVTLIISILGVLHSFSQIVGHPFATMFRIL
jgi:hypothetical protein